MKLSNLKRMATALMPFFLLVLEFDGKNDPERGFMVHIDKKLTSKILKKVYKYQIKPPNKPLNKRSMTIEYNDSNKLPNLSGASILNSINEYIGMDYIKYVQIKSNHLKSTGFENGYLKGKFTISGSENINDLVKSSLGIPTTIPLVNATGYETRFGLTSQNPHFDFSGGTVEINANTSSKKGFISFSNIKHTATISIPCKIYTTQFYSSLPENDKCFRATNDIIDIIFYPNTNRADITINFSVSRDISISELNNAIGLCRLICTPNEKLEGTISLEEGISMNFNAVGNEAFAPSNDIIELAKLATELKHYFNIGEDISFSLNKLMEDYEALFNLHYILNAEASSMKININTLENDTLMDEQEIGVTKIISARIGEFKIGALIVIVGKLKKEHQSGYKLTPNSLDVAQTYIFSPDQDIPSNFYNTLLIDIENKYKDLFIVKFTG